MARRKGEISFKSRARIYPCRARVQMPHHRRLAESAAIEAAATAIAGGDGYISMAVFAVESGTDFYFKTGSQAHAFQVWFEANVRPYDPWAERLESWATTALATKERHELINGMAATGVTDRLRAAWLVDGRRAAVALLQELEPRFDQMSADTAVSRIFNGC